MKDCESGFVPDFTEPLEVFGWKRCNPSVGFG